GSYQIDGDKHWTPQLVRSWRKRMDELIQWGKSNLDVSTGDIYWKKWPEMAARRPMAQYVGFMEREAGDYLRRYVFFLENGHFPFPGETLPLLEAGEGR